MSLERFVGERSAEWGELEILLHEAGRRPDRLPPRSLRRLGALYRAAAADLAAARRRFPREPVVDRLEDLVGRGRALVYSRATRRGSALAFMASGYWRRILERPRPLLLAAALTFAPAVLCAAWGAADPVAASALAPDKLASIGEPGREGHDLGLPVDQQAAFSSTIFTNNIRVSFLAFAGGITGGALTVFVLLYNGALLGAVTGIALSAGNGKALTELIIPHGVLEISCIVVTGAAGLRLGAALIHPGRRRRSAALVDEGRATAEIVLGTAPWLVLAGLVEGFITPAGTGLPAAVGIGVGLGTVYWCLAAWRGRGPSGGGPALTAGLGP